MPCENYLGGEPESRSSAESILADLLSGVKGGTLVLSNVLKY